MPRRNSGARLRFFEKRGCYYIVWTDSGRSRERSTGTADRALAEQTLADFIHANQRSTGPKGPEKILVTDVLDDYAREHGPTTSAPWRIGQAVGHLVAYWQGKPLAHITQNTCRDYTIKRARAAGTTRRELGVLRAAINHAHREGRVTRVVNVWLPGKPDSRVNWITWPQAKLLYREALLEPRARHLPLFVLLGLFTGQRKSAILSLRWTQVDLVRGIIDFNLPGSRRTNKKRAVQPIAPMLLKRLIRAHAHAALHAIGEHRDITYVVNENGEQLKDVKRSFASAAGRAKLSVTPHVLRHTCATWLMQRAVPLWEASGFLGMSRDTLERVYGHHHPEFMKRAVDALAFK